MKRVWIVMLVVFFALLGRLGAAFHSLPFEFRPNWFTIIPLCLLFVAFVGAVIRHESAPAKARPVEAQDDDRELREWLAQPLE